MTIEQNNKSWTDDRYIHIEKDYTIRGELRPHAQTVLNARDVEMIDKAKHTPTTDKK